MAAALPMFRCPLRLSCTSLPAAQGKGQDDGGGLISMLQQSDEDEEGGSGGLPPGMLERLRLLMAMRGAGAPRPPVRRPPLLPSFDLQGVAELIRSGECCVASLWLWCFTVQGIGLERMHAAGQAAGCRLRDVCGPALWLRPQVDSCRPIAMQAERGASSACAEQAFLFQQVCMCAY